MRILLDENLPRKLAGYLVNHHCRSVAESGWSGKRNGELLALADPLFDVLSPSIKASHTSKACCQAESRC